MRLIEWRSKTHHDFDIKPHGNSMTQEYYTKNILPHYASAIHLELLQTTSWPRKMLLQEDNDGSHRHGKDGLAHAYRARQGITLLRHPSNSPDLNPIEACWNIIKQRLQYHEFNSETELKQAIQEEWKALKQSEIQDRIADLQDRCWQLVESGGKRFKSAKW